MAKELEAAKAARKAAKLLKKARRKMLDGRAAVCEVDDNNAENTSTLGATLKTSFGRNIVIPDMRPSCALSAFVGADGIFGTPVLTSAAPKKDKCTDSSSLNSSPLSSPAPSHMSSPVMHDLRRVAMYYGAHKLIANKFAITTLHTIIIDQKRIEL